MRWRLIRNGAQRLSLVENAHLPLLRQKEIEAVRSWFKPGIHVLEIGGGNGYQASVIASWGCNVKSIDLPQAGTAKRYFPVQDYDGQHLPFSDESFDLVFSSNVLEHIELLDSILLEISRVLTPGGLAVHILPSPSWRVWTSLAHYPAMLRYVIDSGKTTAKQNDDSPSVQRALRTHSVRFLISRALFAGPHGVYPNALYELYYFSKSRWRSLLRKGGFLPIMVTTNGLFYTGYGLLPSLSIRTRRCLARVFGSACHIFVLKKTQSQSGS